MSWQKAIILNPNEQVLHSWSGNCERNYKTVVPEKGFIRTKYVSRDAKEQHSGELVLTNKRLLWLERRGMLSKTYRASFEIDLLNLQGITCGGLVKSWVSITNSNGESIFHLRGVGKKEIEPFKDMILRQVEKLRESQLNEAPAIHKEVITKEVVMIPCEYCRSLMPQTSTFCPSCGARRKG
jgi:hypothetical protein